MKAVRNLRNLNHVLSIFVFILAVYIIIWPFTAQVTWWLQHEAPVVSGLTAPTVDIENVPDKNTLLIPRLSMSEEIHEGQNISTVHKGVWRRPNTSSPDQESNTVLVGHRFTYDGASVFYHLDKVQEGDEIIVYWNDQRFDYTVEDIKVVPPEAIDVEAPTDDSVLTLYTCTPLITAENRLVVTARLKQ